MKRIRHMGKCVAGAVILHLLLVMTALAADGMKVMETHTGGSDIAIYIKGIEEDVSDAAVHIGTAPCASVESGSLSALNYPVKTLVMLDNSLSVPQQDRETIAEMLQNMISDRASYEEIAMATYDERLRYLTDYTSDYTALKSATDSISYEDLETRLTSVLYDLISGEYTERTEDSYWRIVVITDGVDDQSIDSTREELYALMKEKAVPIYTVGIQTGGNQGQLADLFALSRLSSADSFMLNDMTDLMDINAALNVDRSIVRFSITPERELMDGSRKNVRISLPSGSSVSVEVAMPQQGMPRPEPSEPDTVPESTLSPEPRPETRHSELAAALQIAVAGAVLLMAIVITVAIVSARSRKKGGNSRQEEQGKYGNGENEDAGEIRNTVLKEGTVIRQPADGGTLYLFRDKDPRSIVLTDMASPARTFHYTLEKTALIGADPACDISIDGDAYISGKHCMLEARDKKLYLKDYPSTNGTFLNNSRIFSETEIVSGDVIQIGDTKLKLTVHGF